MKIFITFILFIALLTSCCSVSTESNIGLIHESENPIGGRYYYIIKIQDDYFLSFNSNIIELHTFQESKSNLVILIEEFEISGFYYDIVKVQYDYFLVRNAAAIQLHNYKEIVGNTSLLIEKNHLSGYNFDVIKIQDDYYLSSGKSILHLRNYNQVSEKKPEPETYGEYYGEDVIMKNIIKKIDSVQHKDESAKNYEITK